ITSTKNRTTRTTMPGSHGRPSKPTRGIGSSTMTRAPSTSPASTLASVRSPHSSTQVAASHTIIGQRVQSLTRSAIVVTPGVGGLVADGLVARAVATLAVDEHRGDVRVARLQVGGRGVGVGAEGAGDHRERDAD